MSWLISSSIGRKLVMSISGLFLIVFLLLHLTINMFIYGGPDAYRAACHFMEHPVILVMVPVLAAGFIVHIIYALVLWHKNKKARGAQTYASGSKTQDVEWSSKNMLALGIFILAFLALHLSHFWAKMQLPHLMGNEAAKQDPWELAISTFSNPIISIIYIVAMVALWFHLTHGFWSLFQTVGLNNGIWMKRLKVIGYIYATVVCLGFISFPIYFLLGLY